MCGENKPFSWQSSIVVVVVNNNKATNISYCIKKMKVTLGFI